MVKKNISTKEIEETQKENIKNDIEEPKKKESILQQIFKPREKKEKDNEIPTLERGFYPESGKEIDILLEEYESTKKPDFEEVNIDQMVEVYINGIVEKLSNENIEKENIDITVNVLYHFVEMLRKNNIGFIQYLERKNIIDEADRILNQI